jgi:hypothetical protein
LASSSEWRTLWKFHRKFIAWITGRCRGVGCIGQADAQIGESGWQMDFELRGTYRLTISRVGYNEIEQLDVRYDGHQQLDGEDIYYFAGPERFYLGIPEHLIGSGFDIDLA